MSSLSSHFKFPILTSPKNLTTIITTALATTVTLVTLSKLIYRSPDTRKIVPSPRETLLPRQKPFEKAESAYPPDAFPGARDVRSPYGTVRVYEWGPEDGQKVMLIHGITTPCVALGSLAHFLADKGCRVILMDLFGRGYSDSPDLPHDSRLYSTQILLALTSSSLSWTPEGFSLIGYSLGGGIAADFAVCSPDLVQRLVLLAPAGLIRESHFGWQSRLLYSGLVPKWVSLWVVGRRLGGASAFKSKNPEKTSSPKPEGNNAAEKALTAEIKGNRDPTFESAPLSKSRPGITVANAVQWQVESHSGFIRSFVSSIRFASITGRNEAWKALAGREGKTLVVVGEDDSVIVTGELREDLSEVLGEAVEWRVVRGAGHEFPISRGEEVGGLIAEFWGL